MGGSFEQLPQILLPRSHYQEVIYYCLISILRLPSKEYRKVLVLWSVIQNIIVTSILDKMDSYTHFGQEAVLSLLSASHSVSYLTGKSRHMERVGLPWQLDIKTNLWNKKSRIPIESRHVPLPESLHPLVLSLSTHLHLKTWEKNNTGWRCMVDIFRSCVGNAGNASVPSILANRKEVNLWSKPPLHTASQKRMGS